MNRRAFVTGLGAVLAAALAARAQPRKAPVVGYLGYDAPGSDPTGIAGLRDGLRELGYVENQNIFIEYRFAESQDDRLAALIRELMILKVDLLLAQGTAVTAAAKRATATIPIVAVAGDPLGSGFVQSLARPGGNITGLSTGQAANFGGKWLEIVKATIPQASLVGVILNPTNRSSVERLSEMESVAPSLGLRVMSHVVKKSADIDDAFVAVTRAHVAAVVIMADPLVVGEKAHVVKAAAAHRVPAIYGFREFVDAGGLMSYGANLADLWRRAATYVDRILKGAKPADLPVEEPRKFELIINLKTAKALGLTIPPSLLLRADQVIDP
jgi:putative tryptophan/tyrosine transport system substrate-binding protein